MKPLFTEEQLNSMSKENIIALMQAMQKHQQKQETKIQILEEKTKELESVPDGSGPEMEEIHPASYNRKKRTGKKEEDLSAFETTEVIQYKLEGAGRYCLDCGTKYKVVTKETVKRLKSQI